MLFNASIQYATLQDDEKLIEQLYVFLKHYVGKRLIYESYDEVQDCVQETVFHIYTLLKNIDSEELQNINIEKYIYNRAMQYVMIYLRKLKLRRDKLRNYMSDVEYKNQLLQAEEYYQNQPIVYSKLASIVDTYNLSKNHLEIVRALSENMLINLGYLGFHKEVSKEIPGYSTMKKLSYSIVDEYLVSSISEDWTGDEHR